MSNLRTIRVDAVQLIKVLRSESEKMPEDQPLRALLQLSAQCLEDLARQLIAAKDETRKSEEMLQSYMQSFMSKRPKGKIERYGAPEVLEHEK